MSQHHTSCMFMLVVLVCLMSLGAMLNVACSLRTARSEPAQPAQFHIERGDEGVYVGSGSAMQTSETRSRTAKFAVELTTLALSQDDQGYWSIGQFWQMEFETDTPDEAKRLSPLRTDVTFAGVGPDAASWCSIVAPRWSAPLNPPSPLGGDLHVGQQWEGSVRVGRTCEAHVRCHVTGEEDVAGRPCLRIDVSPLEALPCAVKDNCFYEGGPPPKTTLTEFDGHIWVAKDNGWVVKVEQRSKLQIESRSRVSTSEISLRLTLQSTRRLTGAEFDNRAAQLARIRNIQHHLRQDFPHYNPAEDADIATEKIAALRQDSPDSPYAPVLAVLEQRFGKQREMAQPRENTESAVSPMVGKHALPFIGSATDGTTVRPSDLRGKPAVLIFLNIDKEFCHQTAPELEAFKQQWQPKGVQVIGIAMRGGRTQEFKDRHDLTFPLITPTSPLGDVAGRDVARLYEMWTTLGTVVLDAEGYIRYYRWGFYPRELGDVLTQLLGQ